MCNECVGFTPKIIAVYFI